MERFLEQFQGPLVDQGLRSGGTDHDAPSPTNLGGRGDWTFPLISCHRSTVNFISRRSESQKNNCSPHCHDTQGRSLTRWAQITQQRLNPASASAGIVPADAARGAVVCQPEAVAAAAHVPQCPTQLDK